MEKYGRARQVTDDNMTQVHCMLDTKGYKHTLSEYVIFIAFPLQQPGMNAPQFCVKVLLNLIRSTRLDPRVWKQQFRPNSS